MAEIKEAPKSFSDRARGAAKRLFRHENAALILILVIIMATLAVMTRGATVLGYFRNKIQLCTIK